MASAPFRAAGEETAAANALIQAVWRLLTQRQRYRGLRAGCFHRLHHPRLTQSLVRRLQRLGHAVSLN